MKAQKELDSVIGQGRLPDFGDRKSLPYISAIVKEILRLVYKYATAFFRFPLLNTAFRWSPVAPLGGSFPNHLLFVFEIGHN